MQLIVLPEWWRPTPCWSSFSTCHSGHLLLMCYLLSFHKCSLHDQFCRCTILLCCIFVFQEAAACSCQCYFIAIHWHVLREVKRVYMHVPMLSNLAAFINWATYVSACVAQTTESKWKMRPPTRHRRTSSPVAPPGGVPTPSGSENVTSMDDHGCSADRDNVIVNQWWS